MLPRATPRRIRVLVVDDHQLYAEAVTLMLDLEPQIEVVGVARDGVQAIDCAQRLRPDVVLMDIDMPKLDGIQATRITCDQLDDVRVVVVSSSDAPEDVWRARNAGAVAYLVKDSAPSALVAAVFDAAGHAASARRHGAVIRTATVNAA